MAARLAQRACTGVIVRVGVEFGLRLGVEFRVRKMTTRAHRRLAKRLARRSFSSRDIPRDPAGGWRPTGRDIRAPDRGRITRDTSGPPLRDHNFQNEGP